MDSNISKSQINEELRRRLSARAVELSLMGRWDEAVQANLQVVELFPEDIHAHNRLGRAYFELGRYEEAAAAYEHSLQQQPSNAIARKRLSELYAALDRESEAMPDSTAQAEDMEAADEEPEEYLEEEEIELDPSEEGHD